MSYRQGPAAAQSKNVPLLERFMCRICEKWKDPASFSNKELSDYGFKVSSGSRINGITARLRCRVCSGGAVTEKQCEGACKMWKDLQKFSKSARRSGGSQTCMACTMWVESQEPDMVTQDLPSAGDAGAGGDSDDDDGDATYYDDPEAGESDSDYEDYARTSDPTSNRSSHVSAPVPGARQTPSISATSDGPPQHMNVPYNALATLSVNGANATSNVGTGRTMLTANLSTQTMSGARNTPGSASQPGFGPTSAGFDISSQSSGSNPYEASSKPKGAKGAWGAMDARRRPVPRAAPVTYTGWDNKGRPHTQQKYASAPDSRNGSRISSAPFGSSPSTPVPAVPAQVPVATRNARNSNWARPATSRNQPPVQPPEDDSDSEGDLYDM